MNKKDNDTYQIVEPVAINYAELMLDVVNQTDQENWSYFSEDNTQLATDFLDYGAFSRVIISSENGNDTAVAYIQLRLLKKQSPQLLYKDLYHLAGLDGIDLWEKSKYSREDLPIYIDVIAVKKEYQNHLELVKLIPIALFGIIKEINESISGSAKGTVFAVGVTEQGRKMCQMLKMGKCSEVNRIEDGQSHVRTLYQSNRADFEAILNKLTSRKTKRSVKQLRFNSNVRGF
jgi:hypothetical protein